MKAKQKLLMLCCAFISSLLSSCVTTVYESDSTQPTIVSYTDAINSIKESIKHPGKAHSVVLSDVSISDEGITLFYNNNDKKYFSFNKIKVTEITQDLISGPDVFWVTLTPGFELLNFGVFDNYNSAKMFADAIYYLKHHDLKKERAREHEDCLRLSRQTPIDIILAGVTVDGLNLPYSSVPKAQIESILNEKLIEWKSNGLGERLQKSSSGQLSDLVVQIEKGILTLDLKVNELKDAADEDARQVQTPGAAAPVKKTPDALKMSHLLNQRKTILMVILDSVKRAIGVGRPH